MAFTPGTRLGVYQVTAQIGEGGMGSVYRATDTSLSRQVAIKVLPDAFAQDADRLARFEARISRSGSRAVPFPVDEALPIAKQIAEALEAAHEQGIIHRDLKPGVSVWFA